MKGHESAAILKGVILIALTVVGCGPSGDVVDLDPSQLEDPNLEVDAAAMEGVEVAYKALRTYTEYAAGATTSYQEMFHHSNDGRTAVEIMKLGGETFDQLPDAEAVADFNRLKSWFTTGLGVFVANWRDFEVKDLDLFKLNYKYLIVAESTQWACREAIVAKVIPYSPDRPNYLVWSDKATGVALRILEFHASGALAAEMSVDSLEYTFDFLTTPFPDLSFVTYKEITEEEVPAYANCALYHPLYLPAGFSLRSIRVSSVSGYQVLTWVWTDGVVELMMAEYPALSQGIPVPDGYPADTPMSVNVANYGATLDAWMIRYNTQIHVAGKLAEDELKSVIQSLVPYGQ